MDAHRATKAIKGIVDKKAKPFIVNGERYFELEDWQTIGHMYGITPKVIRTAFVTYDLGPGLDSVRGFTAEAVALLHGTTILSAAEADCLNDEPKWRARPKYERGKKIGEDPVPLFQMKSMAQTRASSKVLRQVLSWVVVLAGYRPTPAEELDETYDWREPVRDIRDEAPRPLPAKSESSPSAAMPAIPSGRESGHDRAATTPATSHVGTIVEVTEAGGGEL